MKERRESSLWLSVYILVSVCRFFYLGYLFFTWIGLKVVVRKDGSLIGLQPEEEMKSVLCLTKMNRWERKKNDIPAVVK